MGRPYPGHDVRVIEGEIAVRCARDPVVFLGYWRNLKATAEKIREGWLRTGDLAEADEEGYLRYLGRADDIIQSGGYRIGPGEIEQCLLRHSAVLLAAAVGSPDEVRGEIVKAFVVLAPGAEPSPELAAELQAFVRSRLGVHEYPREVEFANSLPLTTTGKVRRGELRRLEAARKRRMGSP
jgi:acetyl-CoA synthetase